MAVRRLKNSITVSGDDLNDLKAALKKLVRPAEVPDGYAQCPFCKRVLLIQTTEQTISGTCDSCWDDTFAEPVYKPETEEEKKKNAEHYPF